MAEKRKKRISFFTALILIALLALLFVGRAFFSTATTIHHLLTENKQLKKAITNLTVEDQIGYAKVLGQESRQDGLYTTIKFVETARDDNSKKILEKDYTIKGDIIHFDALIVKFGQQMVMDGRNKALYLWRRVYSENIAPQNGLVIEQPDAEPQRYADLLKLLPPNQKEMFWSSIWQLAHDPELLKEYDIEAVYGNVLYSKLRPGYIYFFKISPTGQLYPQIVPDL
ncbi:MAG: hypothetical protein ACYTE8_07145 [Planctomycetota bacterium]|jgi:hypothetical protein